MKLRFGEYEFDSAARQLSRSGEPVHLEPKAFELLDLLLERRPAAVPKADIHDRLWPETFVSEGSLTTLVTQLRRALGEGSGEPRRVRTVHGFGYAFDGQTSERVVPAPAERAGPCLLFQGRVFQLGPGENLIGRDEGAQVILEAPGISRRHARIEVGAQEVTIEDLGSKNGTFLEDRRIQGRTSLADRCRIRLGRSVLLYRRWRVAPSTETEGP